MRSRYLLIAAALLTATWPAGATFGQFDDDLDLPIDGLGLGGLGGSKVEVKVSLSHDTVAPGRQFHVAVHGRINGDYWLYSATPRGEVEPMPLRVTVEAPGWTVGQALYPRPTWHTVSVAGITDANLVYERQVTVLVPVTAAVDAKPGTHPLTIRLTGQLCDDKGCYDVPGHGEPDTVEIAVEVAAKAVADPSFSPETPVNQLRSAAEWDAELPREPSKASNPLRADGDAAAGASMTLWAALALAILAGVSLNVMPCVLPVIPLKIMALTEQAKHSRRKSITLGMAYAAGILGFFLVMGVLSAVARATTGELLGLNDPFKYPAVIIGMGLTLVLAALWMLDLYSINVGLRAGGVQGGQGHGGALVTGLLTGVLATPCSGPVLASIFAWAQGQPAWASVAVFVLLGIGMAAPHALLASFPGLLAKLPKPGLWMERFKQAMALVLMAVAIWLFSTLGDAVWMAWVAVFAIVLSLCVWIAGRWVGLTTPPTKRRVTRVAAMLVAVAAGLWMLPEPPASIIPWQPFNEATIQQAPENNQVVLTKFTARTCFNCMVVDRTIYAKPDVAEKLDRAGVVPIKADVSRAGSPSHAFLRGTLGEHALPVTLIHGPGLAKPIRLRGVFEIEELYEALDTAAGKK